MQISIFLQPFFLCPDLKKFPTKYLRSWPNYPREGIRYFRHNEIAHAAISIPWRSHLAFHVLLYIFITANPRVYANRNNFQIKYEKKIWKICTMHTRLYIFMYMCIVAVRSMRWKKFRYSNFRNSFFFPRSCKFGPKRILRGMQQRSEIPRVHPFVLFFISKLRL